MSLRIDCFLNSCENLIQYYLAWLSSFQHQRESYSKWESVRGSYDGVVENFTDLCEKVFETPEYKIYADHQALRLLKELYELADEHWYKTQEIFRLNEEELLSDPEWIKIRDLAKQTKEALEPFVKEERKKDPSHER